MRREFTAKVKVAAFQRSQGHCEGCTARLMPGRYAYDHILPDALGGEPTLLNCAVLCSACHDAKTHTGDVPQIAKMKRQRVNHLGARVSRNPLPCGRSSPWKKTMSGKVVRR